MEKEQFFNKPESGGVINPQETSVDNESTNSLIREKIKRISVFGTFDKQDPEAVEKWKELGKELADLGLTVIVGGDKGSIENVSSGVIENAGKVIVVKTTVGKEAGFATENIPGHLRGVYYEDEQAGKFRGLFNRSGAYIVLPGGKKGTGTETEMRFALDKIDSFDKHVGKLPNPVIFVGEHWKKEYEGQIKHKYDKNVWDHVYFIESEKEIEPILLKYAKLKQEHEQK